MRHRHRQQRQLLLARPRAVDAASTANYGPWSEGPGLPARLAGHPDAGVAGEWGSARSDFPHLARGRRPPTRSWYRVSFSTASTSAAASAGVSPTGRPGRRTAARRGSALSTPAPARSRRRPARPTTGMSPALTARPERWGRHLRTDPRPDQQRPRPLVGDPLLRLPAPSTSAGPATPATSQRATTSRPRAAFRRPAPPSRPTRPVFTWTAIPGATQLHGLRRPRPQLHQRLPDLHDALQPARPAGFLAGQPGQPGVLLDRHGRMAGPSTSTGCLRRDRLPAGSVFQKRSEGIHRTAPVRMQQPAERLHVCVGGLPGHQPGPDAEGRPGGQGLPDRSRRSATSRRLIETKIVTSLLHPLRQDLPRRSDLLARPGQRRLGQRPDGQQGGGRIRDEEIAGPGPALPGRRGDGDGRSVPPVGCRSITPPRTMCRSTTTTNFSSPITTATTKMTAWAYAEPLAPGTYYWRVRRNDADNRDGAVVRRPGRSCWTRRLPP